MILKRILLALFLTTFVFMIVQVIDRVAHPPVQNTAFNTFSFISIFGSILTAVFVGLPNILFLLLLYYTKLGKEFLSNIKLLILEICLLLLCSYLVGKVVEWIPDKWKFYYEQREKYDSFVIEGGTKIKPYLSDGFQLIYTFIILFLLLLLIKKAFISRKKSVFSDSE